MRCARTFGAPFNRAFDRTFDGTVDGTFGGADLGLEAFVWALVHHHALLVCDRCGVAELVDAVEHERRLLAVRGLGDALALGEAHLHRTRARIFFWCVPTANVKGPRQSRGVAIGSYSRRRVVKAPPDRPHAGGARRWHAKTKTKKAALGRASLVRRTGCPARAARLPAVSCPGVWYAHLMGECILIARSCS